MFLALLTGFEPGSLVSYNPESEALPIEPPRHPQTRRQNQINMFSKPFRERGRVGVGWGVEVDALDSTESLFYY